MHIIHLAYNYYESLHACAQIITKTTPTFLHWWPLQHTMGSYSTEFLVASYNNMDKLCQE